MNRLGLLRQTDALGSIFSCSADGTGRLHGCARQYKKLHDDVAADVNAAVCSVEILPKIGDQKSGDLVTLCVRQSRNQGPLYLLGYTIGNGTPIGVP